MREIEDKDLRGFCKWYEGRFGKREDAESVFVTSLCGAFHSCPKVMKAVLKRMADLGLIRMDKGKITIA